MRTAKIELDKLYFPITIASVDTVVIWQAALWIVDISVKIEVQTWCLDQCYWFSSSGLWSWFWFWFFATIETQHSVSDAPNPW